METRGKLKINPRKEKLLQEIKDWKNANTANEKIHLIGKALKWE